MSFFQMLRYLVFNLLLRLGICLPLKGTHSQHAQVSQNRARTKSCVTGWGSADRSPTSATMSLNVELPCLSLIGPCVCDQIWKCPKSFRRLDLF